MSNKRPIAALFVLLLALPPAALAQESLTTQARDALAQQLAAAPPLIVVVESRMESPTLFWIGVGLLAVGVVAVVASVSFDRESDLSAEYSNVRLGRDLAPCGTDPAETTQPIAECKVNDELLWVGGGIALVGGGLMVYGGRQIQQVRPDPPGIRYTLKF